jgi:hypothetical protein
MEKQYKQTTSQVLMIRPAAFTYNAETAVNNAFQKNNASEDIQQKALGEFDAFVAKLRAAGIIVTVVQDSTEPHTPDSIFPNNWISFHQDGTIVLYPMFAKNRRAERKPGVTDTIAKLFDVKGRLDFTGEEAKDRFLEGTGSMVLDRENRIAYACLSARTDQQLFIDWCRQMQYEGCSFVSKDENGGEIYHTNVMMCVADRYVVICLDSIVDPQERKRVIDTIQKTQKQVVEISYAQMNQFAGNMLQLENQKGEKFLVMSSSAYHALSAEQVEQLEGFNPIIHADLTTIETNGGGSARCMIAEVFLPRMGV